jgi:uncharacterized protein with FMN-binding domain
MSGEKVYSLDEVIKMGTEIGVKIAIDYLHKEKDQRRKSRYDRRLRNTKLLLKEYRKLAIHSKDAICSGRKVNAIDLLDELDGFEYDDQLYIESIKSSKERTKIIVEHIQKMIRIFKFISYKSKKPENARRYEVIYDMYISGKEATVDELSTRFCVESRSIYRDVDIAVEDLATLIFGIDGLKIF